MPHLNGWFGEIRSLPKDRRCIREGMLHQRSQKNQCLLSPALCELATCVAKVSYGKFALRFMGPLCGCLLSYAAAFLSDRFDKPYAKGRLVGLGRSRQSSSTA